MKRIETTKTPRISRTEGTERYLKDISSRKLLSQEEEKELLRQAQEENSIEARNKLVEANLRFVVNVAANYQSENIDVLDLINVGNEALIKAVERYDRSKDLKFYSYAVWWIKNYIIVFLRDKNLVRLPYNQQENLNEYNRLEERLERELQIEIDSTVIQEHMEAVDYDFFRYALAARGMGHLDAPLNIEEEGATHGDYLLADDWDHTAHYDRDHNNKVINNVLSKLPSHQQRILELFFGFDGEEYSVDDIAEKLNLTPERVRQIKRQSLALLKSKADLKKISNY